MSHTNPQQHEQDNEGKCPICGNDMSQASVVWCATWQDGAATGNGLLAYCSPECAENAFPDEHVRAIPFYTVIHDLLTGKDLPPFEG